MTEERRYYKTTQKDGPTSEMWTEFQNALFVYNKSVKSLSNRLKKLYGKGIELRHEYSNTGTGPVCVTTSDNKNPDPKLWAKYSSKFGGFRPRSSKTAEVKKLNKEFYIQGPCLADMIAELFGCPSHSFQSMRFVSPHAEEYDGVIVVSIPAKDTRVGGKQVDSPAKTIPSDVCEIEEWEYLRLKTEHKKAS